ncbi:type I DNA topoisomerase [Paraflavisolibacter sp. H34]|uniref:type I DNA topoisomerase n=1 Tax=Huijunlia imazamoxiresistens TaxID=3127457 RepID=UPI003018AC66
MKLLIVESPGKIKKLKGILGKEWEVAASVGHITDLPKRELGVDKSNRYKLHFDVVEDKKKVVAALKSKVREVGAENVYLGTDEDREGEAISFHLCQTLGLPYKTTHRVTFNEITQKAVVAAIGAPRTINIHLVAAQECRRGIDRLVGYQISPVLWQFIKGHKGLSAGRVQSVALRLIVEREREIKAFPGGYNFRITGSFTTAHRETIKAKLSGVDIKEETEAEAYLQGCASKVFSIGDIEQKEVNQNPPAPFSTSTLQQEAFKKLRFGAKKTMQLAQKLYENGLITYMRTDSVNLSEDALKDAERFILKTYGPEYHSRRVFKNRNESAQEAHEAIRPTHFDTLSTGIGEAENKLYQLIFNRALASQMAAARLSKTTISIKNNVDAHLFLSTATVVLFDGYLKIYADEEDDQEEEGEDSTTLKHPVKPGDPLKYSSIKATQVFRSPPRRYDEAGLVKELEKRGIGRPSTYASIIGSIQTRGYVKIETVKGTKEATVLLELKAGQVTRKGGSQVVGAEKGKFLPTEVGEIIIRFLEGHFADIIAYDFTAGIEEDFDKIMEQKETYLGVISRFDGKLSGLIDKTMQGAPAALQVGRPTGLKCPKCRKGELRRGQKNFYCSDYKSGCDFRLYYEVYGKTLEEPDVKDLLEKGRTKVLQGLTGRSGKTFEAALVLDNFKVRPDFGAPPPDPPSEETR